MYTPAKKKNTHPQENLGGVGHSGLSRVRCSAWSPKLTPPVRAW
jgi:hypothetical protein